MVTVDDRNVNLDFNIETNLYLNKAIVQFYSRIIFTKLDSKSKIIFRKAERSLKSYIKINADLGFLN